MVFLVMQTEILTLTTKSKIVGNVLSESHYSTGTNYWDVAIKFLITQSRSRNQSAPHTHNNVCISEVEHLRDN